MSEAIEFECPYCQKRSKVPAKYAGKRGPCPSCKQVIEVPDPHAAEEAAPELKDPASDSGYASAAAEGETKECPMCGETIKKVAKKCKHCKSVLDKRLKARSAAERFGGGEKKSEQMPGPVDWVLVVLCPGIGCIVGIVALIQGYTKRGGLMVGVSVAWSFVVNILMAALNGARGF